MTPRSRSFGSTRVRPNSVASDVERSASVDQNRPPLPAQQYRVSLADVEGLDRQARARARPGRAAGRTGRRPRRRSAAGRAGGAGARAPRPQAARRPDASPSSGGVGRRKAAPGRSAPRAIRGCGSPRAKTTLEEPGGKPQRIEDEQRAAEAIKPAESGIASGAVSQAPGRPRG